MAAFSFCEFFLKFAHLPLLSNKNLPLTLKVTDSNSPSIGLSTQAESSPFWDSEGLETSKMLLNTQIYWQIINFYISTMQNQIQRDVPAVPWSRNTYTGPPKGMDIDVHKQLYSQ